MHLRSNAALSLPLLIAAPTALFATAALGQQSPQQALITSVKGRDITLAIGKNDGAVKGAVYSLTRGSRSARIQVTSVREAESAAQIISQDDGFTITVGDSAKFVEIADMQAPLPAPSGPLGSTPRPAAPAAANGSEATPAPQAIITGVMGKNVTLDIGANSGAKVGAVYAVPLTGAAKVKVQIARVQPASSSAVVIQAADDFVLTVGDLAKFTGLETVRVAAPAPVPQPTAVTPTVPPAMPAQVPPTVEVPSPGAIVQPVSAQPISGNVATITTVKGTTVTVGAGTAQGVNPATNLPVLRGGKIIGLVRVQVATPSTSNGVIIWKDDSVAAISAGDAVGIIGAAPTVGVPSLGTEEDKVPAVTIKYETKAPNTVVPKADPSYELLASLATRGLITSTPASVFSDDGARRHRTAEDITFSRAQIAGFIKEAINNSEGEGAGKSSAALSLLVRNYQKDLQQIGVDKGVVESYVTDGFQVGISGQNRATYVGGDTDNFINSFSDAHGSERNKSGFDNRTNIFGQINKRLTFMATVDSGTDLSKNSNNDRADLRRGYLSYDASNMLRGLTINAGRQEFWWGPGHFGTSLLGDAAGGLNAFNTTFQRGSYKLESLYAPLGHGPVGSPRSLYGQNFSVKVGTQSKIGFANTILSPNDTFDPTLFLASFTPISLYTADRLGNKKDKTNAMVQGYFETSLANGVRTYGELLFDDFSFNGNNPIENRDGSIIGAHFFDPKKPARLGLYTEYARFNSIAYLTFLNAQKDQDYDYFYRGTSLGYPITPFYPIGTPTGLGGAESLRLEGYWMPKKKLRLTAGIEFSDINVEDQAPNANGGAGFSRQQVYRLGASYDFNKRFTLTARAQRVDTDQPNFIKGEGEAKRKQFSIEIANRF